MKKTVLVWLTIAIVAFSFAGCYVPHHAEHYSYGHGHGHHGGHGY